MVDSVKLWYQHLKGTLEEVFFIPKPEEGHCLNRGVEDMQCTVIVYIDNPLVTFKDDVTMAGVIEALRRSYLEMSLDMSKVGVCYITMPIKDVKLVSVVASATGTLFLIVESSLVPDGTQGKWFHS